MAPESKAWTVLAQWLPPFPDAVHWWQLTGAHLANMLDAAGYPVEQQYDALIFHYHWIVPYLGPAPTADGRIRWRSLLGVEGSPLEYSWKWNTGAASSRPDVRYTMEAIGPATGSARDPLNQDAAREMLYRLADAVPSVDLTWTSHFLATLFDHDRAKYAQEAAAGACLSTTVVTAPEFLPGGLNLKTYFVPRRLGQGEGPMPLARWLEPLMQLGPASEARAALFDFLESDLEGRHLSPFMLAVDNVSPSRSRLKLYFQTAHTSFASVRRIMTLGGRINVPETRLQDLRTLIAAVSGLPDGFPDDADVPCVPNSADNLAAKDIFADLPLLISGYLYYFDIAPGAALPSVKFYTPVRSYGPNDLAIARALTRWMDCRGRGRFSARYLTMLESLCQHRRLDEAKGVQTYVSCLFRPDGELDITSYIGPEAFAPSRRPGPADTAHLQPRPTLRRRNS